MLTAAHIFSVTAVGGESQHEGARGRGRGRAGAGQVARMGGGRPLRAWV